MAKQFIPSTELDFQKYKESLKNFLKGQEKFKDYDFEGSNISVLLDLLTYNTFNNAHYLNMVGSEMFLDSAQLRQTIVSQAKELNYTPHSKVSSRCLVTVEIEPTSSPESILIPKNYVFKTSNNLSTLTFLNDQPIVIRRNLDGRYISDQFLIYEGTLVDEYFEVEPPIIEDDGTVRYRQRFNLQSENIDINSLEVLVYDSEQRDSYTAFERAFNLYGLDGDTPVFFVRGYKDNYYEIEFGDGVLGRALQSGNVIFVRYRNTGGAEGDGNFVFSKTTNIDGFAQIFVTTVSRATGGASRESNESIKYNAVRHFQAQERAVNEDDFEVLIKTQFPQISQVSVYGGERVQQYGKVFIVLKTDNTSVVVDNATKNQIVQYIKTKTLVPEPIVVDPDYYILGVTGNVYYDVNYSSVQRDAVIAHVVSALTALNTEVLDAFNKDVYQSTIVDTITDAHSSITGCDVSLSLIKQVIPEFGVSRQYTYTCDNAIKKSLQGPYTNFNEYGVISSIFKIIRNDQIIDVLIQDDGNGLLHLYEVSSGVKLKIPVNVGTVNYDTGEIKFTVDIYSVSPALTFTHIVTTDSINIELNKFISIDSTYININAIP